MKPPALILFAITSCCFAQDLTSKFQSLIDQDAQASRGYWGIDVASLRTGSKLAAINADRYFVPASNTKLYSTALALLRLGPEYQFRTTIIASESPANGILKGDLRLVGGGDPSMSWRAYPYQKNQKVPGAFDPLLGIEELADQIAKQGIRRIEGNIVGDDTRWPWAPYPEGWAGDDATWEYGAPVSALTLNDNAIRLSIQPATTGFPAFISLTPGLEYYWIDNQVLTEAGERKLEVIRAPGSRQLTLQGRISPKSTGRITTVAIDDPALYAATALYEALTRRGILIQGQPSAAHRLPDQTDISSTTIVELARHDSRPLLEILEVINKVSQNLHAEMILREVGLVATREGTTEAGLKELKRLLDDAGVEKNGYDFHDGSGLSRLNLTTPISTTQLLSHLYRSSYREAWLKLMPVGGEDGTLENRFVLPGRSRRPAPNASAIQAKTGSLSHVNTLSGYIESKTHGPVAFSIMVNNFNGPASAIRSVIDKICLEIAQ